MNTIRLLHGECRATSEELKKFKKGDTIWGSDTNPEELKRWRIEQKQEAKKELAALRCRYARYNEHFTDVEEYALEYFEASAELESDLDADAWEELYRQYLGE